MGPDRAVAFLLAALLAGCLSPGASLEDRLLEWTTLKVEPNGVPAALAGPDEYYFVVLRGEETAHRIKGDQPLPPRACDASRTFTYDSVEGRVRYDPAVHDIDAAAVRVLVAVDYGAPRVGPEGVEDRCNSILELEDFPGRADHSTYVRWDVRAHMVVEARDGFLTYNQTAFVPMGKQVHVNLTRLVDASHGVYYVTGDFTAETLGAWKRDRLVPFGAD